MPFILRREKDRYRSNTYWWLFETSSLLTTVGKVPGDVPLSVNSCWKAFTSKYGDLLMSGQRGECIFCASLWVDMWVTWCRSIALCSQALTWVDSSHLLRLMRSLPSSFIGLGKRWVGNECEDMSIYVPFFLLESPRLVVNGRCLCCS